MALFQKRNWDMLVFTGIIVGNAAWITVYQITGMGIQSPVNISSIYEKVRICLTSTSILLAASGFLISGLSAQLQMNHVRQNVTRTISWLSVALLCGITTVAIIPSRLHPNDYLELRHAVMWLWLYLTGPVMYVSLLLGTGRFLGLARSLVNDTRGDKKK